MAHSHGLAMVSSLSCGGCRGAARQPTQWETDMADPGFDDAEPPRRPRRGPPPRLYVIARKSPFPWLRVRRLVEADRAALVTHLGRLAAARTCGRAAPYEAGIAAL